MTLGSDELLRYGRQMVIPEIGREGQERLRASRVLVVGAGGLGSPAALYLAAAGVGRLGVADFDRVELSNLQRQLLYGEADVGRLKTEVAAERLAAANPHVEIRAIGERIRASNAREIVAEYDVVVDGSDNFATRYLINDACVLTGRPDVFGSVLRFEGQVGVFAAADGPCYRCLFPEPPPPGLVPSCAEGGVLGVLPGIIGALQAQEAIKLVLGLGDALVGRLLVFDGLSATFREIEVPRRADCAACGDNPTLTELTEAPEEDTEEATEEAAAYGPEEDVAGEDAASLEEAPFEISPVEVRQWLDAGRPFRFVDVRTAREFEIARVESTTLLPLHELPARIEELEAGEETVVMCHHGIRSAQAVAFLRRQGFSRARNLTGGIAAWSRDVDPSIPRY